HPVPGGTAVAALELAAALVARNDVELVGVAGRHRNLPAAEFRSPIETRQLPIGRPLLYEAWNRTGHPRVERATGPVDVCHSTLAVPAGTKAPHVVTVHDIAFMHTPDRFTRHGSRVMVAGLERCRSATLITCPSEVTRRDLIDVCFDGGRLRVVPWGVEVPTVAAADIDRVRAQYRLPDEFVLFVGTVEPRKNLARLAEAVERSDSELPLVVAGASGWGEQGAHGGQFIGFLPASDLAAVYAAAALFAYPSLQEGFGFPVAEAMAHGVPVVTSRGTSAEEVAGGAAQLVDPSDVASIADGIDAALEHRVALRVAGLERAATMTWSACAESMSAVYHEAALCR
ncbi:MAG TPA: glycosyltransferase family 1 protein, partial [Ilumatobacter sp.]|nr:glycosyltransferase family 1 protein [Ilumatobacter sp.]